MDNEREIDDLIHQQLQHRQVGIYTIQANIDWYRTEHRLFHQRLEEEFRVAIDAVPVVEIVQQTGEMFRRNISLLGKSMEAEACVDPGRCVVTEEEDRFGVFKDFTGQLDAVPTMTCSQVHSHIEDVIIRKFAENRPERKLIVRTCRHHYESIASMLGLTILSTANYITAVDYASAPLVGAAEFSHYVQTYYVLLQDGV